MTFLLLLNAILVVLDVPESPASPCRFFRKLDSTPLRNRMCHIPLQGYTSHLADPDVLLILFASIALTARKSN